MHTPSWNWVWKAYRSLNRKYRKNLKQLVRNMTLLLRMLTKEYLDSTSYILHSSPKVSASMIYCQIIHIRIERKCCFPWPAPLSGLLLLYTSIYSQNSNISCSPKFFQKLIYITTLSELAQYVPLTQIDVPPAVYR